MDTGSVLTTDIRIERQAKQLSRQLKLLSEHLFPPHSRKELRTFSSGEAAQLIGVSDGYLRQLSIDGKGPSPDLSSTGRRSYKLSQINELRHHLAQSKPKDALAYLPHRRKGEKLQTIAVTNFKGGSAKTTTTLYLAQYLALAGYRVLAIDLDPQASLSSMLGVQPEFDVGDGETLYGAIRYDDTRKPLQDIVRKTYFDGLDLVPGNLELMEFEHETPRVLAERRGQKGDAFFQRVGAAISEVEAHYDVVVIDCPPQLGYLTLGAVCAATSMLITIHPQMVDVASMSQFLLMTSDLLSVVRHAGGDLSHDFIKYVVTRHEPFDGPQSQIVALLRSLFGDDVLTATILKSTAISDAGLSRQTLFEIERGQVRKSTYDRALESINASSAEVLSNIHRVWGRK
ncbi:plasmid partitioning protein RepA (plasmid) [Agrobacterium sp. 13-2099-1-2]|uniref:plasmid partitioning protein RepA n=1 Tax=Agrobacterium sp. 13-2099-1-2 TaxID=1841651 RepID=UPI0022A92A91|nr:plasmid partitioning protein RepA [Agrobacterium sp. 13-2099-1-2]UZX45512.1 plasmid partitioning protein RepA [Agrobacterium sp. 13-2099-1-2]